MLQLDTQYSTCSFIQWLWSGQSCQQQWPECHYGGRSGLLANNGLEPLETLRQSLRKHTGCTAVSLQPHWNPQSFFLMNVISSYPQIRTLSVLIFHPQVFTSLVQHANLQANILHLHTLLGPSVPLHICTIIKLVN